MSTTLPDDQHALVALDQAFAAAHAASRAGEPPDYRQRVAHLRALLAAVRAQRDRLAEVVSDDFGNRSRHESLLAEVFPTVSSLEHTIGHLKRWMTPEKRSVALPFRPGSARIVYQPLGVVGVISPWNYPVQLALIPLATALAAGNRVLLKPSELTPATGAWLKELLNGLYPADLVEVIPGGPTVGAAFAAKPFDHLFFTGSTRVGGMVMQAAAKNLTPVTLELGGKSPAIVHPSFPVERAADRISAGKLFNAGQTCIAPDYVLIDRARVEPFVAAFAAQVSKRFPRLRQNPDYTAIISPAHQARLEGLLDDAIAKGATAHEVNPAGESFTDSRKHPPVLLTGVSDAMAVMQEEIFGPVLPVVGVADLDQAIAYVNAHPRPLALYYFDRDRRRADGVLARTTSGGACINDTLLQVVQDDLPFGGVGPSGLGRYHGREGFLTFSHHKGVFHQAALNTAGYMSPPYGAAVERLLRWVIGR